jgi:hypothetical protein
LRWGGFQGRVEDLDVTLAAQIREPGVEEHVDLFLEQNLLNARRDLVQRRNGFAGPVLRKQHFVVVAIDLLRGDLDSLAESLLDEAQNFKPVAEIGFDALRRKAVRGKKCIPSGVSSAILTDAGRELLANLVEASDDVIRRRVDSLHVFLANLLLDQAAADELVKRAGPGERALTNEIGIENGEADFVVDVAGYDGVLVDHCDNAVEDHGGGRVWLLGKGRRQSRNEQRKGEQFRRSKPRKSNHRSFDYARRKGAPRCAQDDNAKKRDRAPRFAQDDSKRAEVPNPNWGALVHQKACPRLKKKLMCGDWPT